MFDFLKTMLLWLFGAGFLAGFFGLSVGCTSSGYVKHTVTALGSTFGYELNNYQEGHTASEDERGTATLTLDPDGFGIFGAFIDGVVDAFRGSETEDPGAPEDTETEAETVQ